MTPGLSTCGRVEAGGVAFYPARLKARPDRDSRRCSCLQLDRVHRAPPKKKTPHHGAGTRARDEASGCTATDRTVGVVMKKTEPEERTAPGMIVGARGPRPCAWGNFRDVRPICRRGPRKHQRQTDFAEVLPDDAAGDGWAGEDQPAPLTGPSAQITLHSVLA
jgi:hypothetical protein